MLRAFSEISSGFADTDASLEASMLRPLKPQSVSVVLNLALVTMERSIVPGVVSAAE